MPAHLSAFRQAQGALGLAGTELSALLPRVMLSLVSFELYVDQFLRWPDFEKSIAMAMRDPRLTSEAYGLAARFGLASVAIIAELRYGLTHQVAQPDAWAWVYTPLGLAKALGPAAASVVPQIEHVARSVGADDYTLRNHVRDVLRACRGHLLPQEEAEEQREVQELIRAVNNQRSSNGT